MLENESRIEQLEREYDAALVKAVKAQAEMIAVSVALVEAYREKRTQAA